MRARAEIEVGGREDVRAGLEQLNRIADDGRGGAAGP
jgi:hypothetical protein